VTHQDISFFLNEDVIAFNPKAENKKTAAKPAKEKRTAPDPMERF
jgi:hypothetical protein